MFTPQPRKCSRWLRQGIIACLVAGLITLVAPAIAPNRAVAQFLPLPGLETTEPLPMNVERQGRLESVAVQLDGEDLFRIASLAVLNRAEVGDQIPVEARARQIEANLQRLLPRGRATSVTLNPETMNVVIETVGQYPVLFARDIGLAESRVLLTVTDADAEYHGLTREALAEEWQGILEQELRDAIALRQPEALRQQWITLGQVLGITGIVTLLLGGLRMWLGQREHYLHQRRTAEAALIEAHDATPEPTSPTDQTGPGSQSWWHQHLRLERRLQGVRLGRWLLFWAMAILWAMTLAYGLNLFPQTRSLARTVVLAPVVILLTWFVVGLIDRLVDLAIDRFMQKLVKGQPMTSTNLQRIHTLAQVIKGVKTVVVYISGGLWVLQWLNLVPGSVIAIGTLVALVISFAAQNLVKDLVNGFLILLEDQFRIGDVVMIGDIDGFVENVNLRITQLRNAEGQLITIPNSSIVHVRNMTRHWSRATLDFEVAYNTDINQALMVIRETADAMAADPQWQPLILDTREFLGVQEISHTGILIRIWIKTVPLKQWLVSMEFRRRLKIAFDKNKIQIGAPRQIWLQEDNYSSLYSADHTN